MRKLVYFLSFLLFSVHALAQEKRVSGTVTNGGDNKSIANATVRVKGSSLATQTDAQGNFTINVPSDTSTLMVSFVGFQTNEMSTTGTTILNFSLAQLPLALNEVVVTGYQTQRKADLTGAVSVVSMKELGKTPVTNPIQSLQGRVPGMVVYTDGSPSGSNVGILIRGVTSINGTGPLYVIDGVPTKGGMHELNPNDIESMQVLKDASSASIYGSRAANGVIIITTKRVKKGEFQINASARRSYSFYRSRMNMLNTEEFGRAAWQASANDALAYGGDPKNNYLLYQYNWSKGTDGNYTLNRISVPEFINDARTMKSANTDWFKEISQTAVLQNYDVSISRGSENGSTLFSLDYTNNEGIVRTTEFRRISARLNTDYRLLKGRFVIGENFTANTTREVAGNQLNNALQALPVIPVHTVDGIGWGGPWGGMNDRQNPVRLLEDNKQNHYDYLRLLGNAYADLEIIKNLHVRSSLGLDYSNFTKRDMQLAYVSGYLNNPVNRVTMDNSNSTKLIWTNTLNYKRVIEKHNIDVIGGTEAYRESNMGFSAFAQNFVSEDPNYMYLGAATGSRGNGGGASEFHLLSYFGKANYSFGDRYLASATLRYDGSSRFGKNSQYGLFPAFSVGWRINNEKFIKNNFDFFSDLKLRYGWGKNGNQDIETGNANRTLYQTNYGSTSYDFNGTGGTLASGYQLIQRSNDDVRWESTSQSNIGLDFGFLNQRIYGSVDYFVKKTTGMLIRPAYIGVIGEGGNRWVNGAGFENKGLEFIVGYKGKIANRINFDVTGNISYYRNKFTILPEEVVNTYGGNGTTDNILGHATGSIYGYVADGIFTTETEVLKSAEQLGKALGRIRYKDLNGDGRINEKDQAWIYNPTPDYTYGVNFNLDYKGFDLNVFFQGIGNQQINVYDVKSQTDFWSINETGSNKGTRLLNAWSVTNPNSTIPALTSTNRNNENRFSTYFIENGAYMKLRNVQLGYNLPRNTLQKIHVNNINVYVSGQNLFTIKAKSFTGVDPEATGFGYPIPTMVTTGVRVSF